METRIHRWSEFDYYFWEKWFTVQLIATEICVTGRYKKVGRLVGLDSLRNYWNRWSKLRWISSQKFTVNSARKWRLILCRALQSSVLIRESRLAVFIVTTWVQECECVQTDLFHPWCFWLWRLGLSVVLARTIPTKGRVTLNAIWTLFLNFCRRLNFQGCA